MPNPSSEKFVFRCGVCGNSKYQRVAVDRPNGGKYLTSFYRCLICSVMFLDPEAFTWRGGSWGKKAEAQPP